MRPVPEAEGAVLRAEPTSAETWNRAREDLFRLRYSTSPQRRRCALTLIVAVMLAAIVMFSSSPRSGAQSTLPSEYELKAAFLFNFAKFIDWPANSFASPQSAFTICVLGQDPFGRALDDNLQRKAVGDHPFAIRRLKDKSESRNCQMIFISSSENAHLSEIVEILPSCEMLVIIKLNISNSNFLN